jgi:hypothetical protein
MPCRTRSLSSTMRMRIILCDWFASGPEAPFVAEKREHVCSVRDRGQVSLSISYNPASDENTRDMAGAGRGRPADFMLSRFAGVSPLFADGSPQAKS